MEAEYNHLNHATWESSFSRRSTARSCCSGRSSGTWAKYFTIWHDGRSAGSRRATCSHADTDTPKYSVAQIIGHMKGRVRYGSRRNVEGKMRNFLGHKFRGRGYFVRP
jgi:putative transposase